MSSKEYEFHARIVGWLQIAGSSIFIAAAIFLFLFFAGIGIGSGELEAFGILSAIGLSTGFFLVLLALPGLVVGWGVLNRRPWSRIMGIVVGIIDLAVVPIGTVIGGYTLWILLDKEAAEHFGDAEAAS